MRRTSALTVSSFQIENWKFCSNSSDDCKSADRGEFIDVTLVIKSRGKPKFRSEEEKEKLLNKARAGQHGGHGEEEGHNHPRCFKRGKYNKCPKEFDIGGGSDMMLSSQVKHYKFTGEMH